MKKIPWHGFFPGWVANPGSFSLIFPLLYRWATPSPHTQAYFAPKLVIDDKKFNDIDSWTQSYEDFES
jgi:hypothetical protein